MAKIDVSQKMYTIEGEVIKQKESPESEEKAMTLRDVLVACAMNEMPKEELAATRKAEYFILGMEIKKAKDFVEIKNKDKTDLDERCSSLFNTSIYGQVNHILEGKNNPLKPK